jgi:O-antigen/teichoic acid export membrane protein
VRDPPAARGAVTVRRRIARNTGVQIAGEVVSRLALVAFYAILARELGKEGLGQFTFALSLSLVLLLPGGLGLDEVVARTVARDRRQIGQVFWSAVSVKLTLGGLGVAIAALLAAFGGYGHTVSVALVVLAFSALLEILTPTLYSIFQGLNDMLPEALSLLAQRSLRAGLGIAVLLAGGGVEAAAAVYLVGATGGLLLALLIARRRRVSLAPELSTDRVRVLVSAALPIGVGAVFTVVLWRVDAVLLGWLKDDTAVGVYGAATRLIEAPLFLGAAFVAAMLPVLSRLTRTTTPTAGTAYEGGCAVLVAALAPIAAALVLFAEPVCRLLYGAEFADAAQPVRVLGATVAVLGLAQLSLSLLVSQDRVRAIPWAAGSVMVGNVLLNLALIPDHSFNGAAVAGLASEVTFAAALGFLAIRAVGRISAARVALGPLGGVGAMVAVTAVAGSGLAILPATLAAYAGVVAAVELARPGAGLRGLREGIAALRGEQEAAQPGGGGGAARPQTLAGEEFSNQAEA